MLDWQLIEWFNREGIAKIKGQEMGLLWSKSLRAAAVSLCLTATAQLAHADAGPVVVELYTSQGCSSCPPADALLTQLTRRADVIALGLHVDYWDYLGWQDKFADAAYSERQRNYARAAGKSMVYTPQMVVGGRELIVGSKPAELDRAIKARNAATSPVSLSVTRDGDRLLIEAQSTKNIDAVVQLVRYIPKQDVKILRGENRGKTISYYNIVDDWRPIKDWKNSRQLRLKTKLPDGHYVVIIQRAGHREILAAAHVE
jgi:hypothetical protein